MPQRPSPTAAAHMGKDLLSHKGFPWEGNAGPKRNAMPSAYRALAVG